MRPMATMTFVCPKTGDRIEAGIETDRSTLAGIGWVRIQIGCRSCGDRHEMKVRDARLETAMA